MIRLLVYNCDNEVIAVINQTETGFEIDHKAKELSKDPCISIPLLLRGENISSDTIEYYLKMRITPSRNYIKDMIKEEFNDKEPTLIDRIKLNSGRTMMDTDYIIVEEEGLKSELVTISSLTDLGELETEANDIF